MQENLQILDGHSDREKTAYLTAIASIATADRQASPEEMDYITALVDAAGLQEQDKQSVLHAATDLSGKDLSNGLDVLKNSHLRFSLIADLITFAKSDQTYSEEEEEDIERIAEYLGVNQQQYAALDQFAQKASSTNATPEEMTQPGFLSSHGLNDTLQSAGINTSGLLKGLIGIAGPMILSSIFSKRLGGGRTSGGFGSGGGLGSLIGMLSGGRGFNSMGGLLGRVLGGGGRI